MADFSVQQLCEKINSTSRVKEVFLHKYPGVRVSDLLTTFNLVKKCVKLGNSYKTITLGRMHC